MRRFALALVVVGFAGCGSGGDSASTSTPAAAPATATRTADGVQIGMKGLQFLPKAVTVKVGQTVTWKNEESIPHNVTADSGASFRSDTFGQDKTFSYKTKKAGTIKYECTIHPGMVGTITVEG